MYEEYKQKAKQTHRSVEAELVDAVKAGAPESETLPPDLAKAISDLEALGDEALWRAARHTLPPETSAQLESLHLKRQDEGLTEAERETVEMLVRQYERTMLVRAYAARLLKERGHDISGLPFGR